MPDWLWFVAFFVVYIVLMRWVLPYLGVRTWMAEGVESRRTSNKEQRTAEKWHAGKHRDQWKLASSRSESFIPEAVMSTSKRTARQKENREFIRSLSPVSTLSGWFRGIEGEE